MRLSLNSVGSQEGEDRPDSGGEACKDALQQLLSNAVVPCSEDPEKEL